MTTTNLETISSILDEGDEIKEIPIKTTNASTSILLKNKHVDLNFDTKNYTHLNSFTESTSKNDKINLESSNVTTCEINLYK